MHSEHGVPGGGSGAAWFVGIKVQFWASSVALQRQQVPTSECSGKLKKTIVATNLAQARRI